MMCEPFSDRIIVMRLKTKPVNLLLVQIYAPCQDTKNEEKERFYESLDEAIKNIQRARMLNGARRF